MRRRKFRLTRARSMLGLRDAREIGIGQIARGLVFSCNFYFWRIRASTKRYTYHFWSRINGQWTMKRKLTKERAWMNTNCERAESRTKSQVYFLANFSRKRKLARNVTDAVPLSIIAVVLNCLFDDFYF